MQNYQRLKEIREIQGANQVEVSDVLQIKQSQYSRYERGERELPMHHFITLAKFYNVSLDYLAGLTDEPRKLR